MWNIPLYPRIATVIVSKAHNIYKSMMENFRAQLLLHLVHCVPSWIPAKEHKRLDLVEVCKVLFCFDSCYTKFCKWRTATHHILKGNKAPYHMLIWRFEKVIHCIVTTGNEVDTCIYATGNVYKCTPTPKTQGFSHADFVYCLASNSRQVPPLLWKKNHTQNN